MQHSDFKGDISGSLLQTLEGHTAFLPSPLPPTIQWDDELIHILSAADRALGRLSGIGDTGAINPHLLIRPFVRREAVLSSQIEGTQATLSDLFLFEEANPSVENQVPDVREVSNYVRALEFGLDRLRQRPVSCSLIKELHQILMTDVRGGDKTPGAFREIQVFIGSTPRIEDARYVPPPPLEVKPAMQLLEQYLQSPSNLPPLVRLALVHYQFEAIHPFHDGNGRIGRLLITLLLCAEGLLSLPMLYLSAYFERHRQDYYRHLLEVSRRGAWSEWITFFLRGVTEEAADAVDRVARLMSLRAQYQARVQAARASAMALKLIDLLFSSPAITVRRASAAMQLTPAAAQNHIDRFVADGILTETTGQRRSRIYLATDILRVLNENIPDVTNDLNELQ